VVGLLLAMGVVASVIWLFRSPVLSIERVEVSGVAASAAGSVLTEAGLVVGTPLITVDEREVEARLEEDPWVVEATVSRQWPDVVSVDVVERVPVAWISAPTGSGRMAIDGVVVSVGDPPQTASVVWTDLANAVEPGSKWDDRRVLGALEFLEALRDDLAVGAVVDTRGAEIVAEVAGFRVRLGLAAEMQSKSRVLAVVIDSGPEEGSEITLLSPERPAVLEPSSTPPPPSDKDQDSEQ
jgi:cell division protein FtsQ